MRQSRSFQLQPRETTVTDMVVSGIVKIYAVPASILIDSGSTHSFVSHHFAKHLDKPLELLNYDLSIAIPVGAPLVSSGVFKGCVINIGR